MTILEMNHISKSFGGAKALSDVHLSIEKGEIHALLGENGAGKSTLMNILTGVIPADEGTITFLGKQYPSPTIQQMEAAGIAFVHQELNVINDLSVSDNIFLCREIKTKLGLIDQKEQLKRTRQLFEDLGVDMNPSAMVSELKTSEKQLLEMAEGDAPLIGDILSYFRSCSEQLADLKSSREKTGAVLKDALCVIGTTASSTTDYGLNAYQEQYPNVGVHASMANQLLCREFVDDSPWFIGVLIAVISLVQLKISQNKSANS